MNIFVTSKEPVMIIEKSKKASKEVMDSIRPMVERNRQILLKEKNQGKWAYELAVIMAGIWWTCMFDFRKQRGALL